MTDFIQIDFLAVGDTTSGDAITLQYSKDGTQNVHIIDGGFNDTGSDIINHITTYYGNSHIRITRVIVTHQDGDHTKGLKTVLENMDVDELWMLRPWLYADQLIEHFQHWSNVDNLKKHLKEIYSNIADLEEIAEKRRIKIKEPFQSEQIGDFMVLAPSKERYLELVIQSEKTPEISKESQFSESVQSSIYNSIKRYLWGDENLSKEPTSAENEMSIVQYGKIDNRSILFTGDAGIGTITEAISYLKHIYGDVPQIGIFHVPHHGSRRNISSEILDTLFGDKVSQSEYRNSRFQAVISAGKNDPKHPRKATIRALYHRAANVVATKGKTICFSSTNAPERNGWTSTKPLDYPEDQEE